MKVDEIYRPVTVVELQAYLEKSPADEVFTGREIERLIRAEHTNCFRALQFLTEGFSLRVSKGKIFYGNKKAISNLKKRLAL